MNEALIHSLSRFRPGGITRSTRKSRFGGFSLIVSKFSWGACRIHD